MQSRRRPGERDIRERAVGGRDHNDHDHYHRERLKPLVQCIPSKLSDLSALICTLVGIVSTYLVGLMLVVPLVHGHEVTAAHWFHRLMATWLLVNILWSFYKLIRVDTSTRSLLLPSLLRSPDWHFCYVCEANAPPRAFHCSTCGTCVLRRDHHCLFSGCCVGYFNLRFYLSFLIYLTVGGLYASTMNMFYIWDLLAGEDMVGSGKSGGDHVGDNVGEGGFSGFGLWTLIVHFLPFPFFLTGYLTLKQFLSALLSMVDITGSLLCLVLAYHHLGLVRSNQTTYERNHRVHKWDLGDPLWNTRECLSSRWLWTLAFPMAAPPLPRDGIHFPTRDEYKSDSTKTR